MIRHAELRDLDALMPLVRDFYIYEKLQLDETHYLELTKLLIAPTDLGHLLVVDEQRQIVGYAVVGFGFSLEFGGRDALLDELYISPSHRGHGLGTQLISYIEGLCRDAGIRAVHLEADHFNVRVHEYYKRIGFRDHDRHLMTKWL